MHCSGLYSTNLTFDRAGEWAIQATVLGDDASPKRARLFFEVPEASKAPAIGDAAVRSVNRTERDVESLAELTTGFTKDPDLYQLTIADAVESGKPTVIVMASPAFWSSRRLCVSGTCPAPSGRSSLTARGRSQADSRDSARLKSFETRWRLYSSVPTTQL